MSKSEEASVDTGVKDMVDAVLNKNPLDYRFRSWATTSGAYKHVAEIDGCPCGELHVTDPCSRKNHARRQGLGMVRSCIGGQFAANLVPSVAESFAQVANATS